MKAHYYTGWMNEIRSDGSAAEAGTSAPRSADESHTSAHAQGNPHSLRERSISWLKSNKEKISSQIYWKDLISHKFDNQPATKRVDIIIIITSPVIVFGSIALGYRILGLACDCIIRGPVDYIGSGCLSVWRFAMEGFKKTASVFWNLYIWIQERVRRRNENNSSASMQAEGRDVELVIAPSTGDSPRTISSGNNSEETVVSDNGRGGSVSSLKKDGDGDSKPVAMGESRTRTKRVHFRL
ncbi:hypothetical protein D9613_008927 [Agrocybe pediades]|uniref:Uncharacterized protein n=1 Tax=Agrocybe pediades TaxID=84607 RepID=A0A8H4VQR0_9AGAR|nr:hypothetical protein D9613_008927 [Agrocybe pediades]